MNLQFSEQTHIGMRENNEDFFIHTLTDKWAFFAVADGVGGQPGGALASHFFCEALIQALAPALKHVEHDPAKVICEVFSAAQLTLRKRLMDAEQVEGLTTCATVLVSETMSVAAHIGDSRIYRITPKKIEWHSKDHSRVQDLLDKGVISETEMGAHPEQHIISKWIGANDSPKPSVQVMEPLGKKEALLLCTDGFWDEATPKEMISVTQAKQVDRALSTLIRKLVSRANRDCDNITAQVIRPA